MPSATLATLNISDPLVIALLLAFVDVFHHLLVLDARRVNVLLANSYTQMQTFRYEVDGIPSGKLACPAHQGVSKKTMATGHAVIVKQDATKVNWARPHVICAHQVVQLPLAKRNVKCVPWESLRNLAVSAAELVLPDLWPLKTDLIA